MPIHPATAAAARTVLTAAPPPLSPVPQDTPFRTDASPLVAQLPPASSLTYKQCNRTLPQGVIRTIVRMRNDMEAGFSYNSLNDLFTICNRAKALYKKDQPAPFAAAWGMGPPTELIDPNVPYTGGTCFASAPYLQQRISRVLGFKAYVAGTYGGPNLLVRWPSLTSEQSIENPEALARLGGINHADVLVPLRANKNAPLQLLHIQCGLGSSDANWTLLQAPHDTAKIDKLRLLSQPQLLRWQGISSSLSTYISDPTRRLTFGINLLEGDFFLSSQVAEKFTLPMQGRSFHFAALIHEEEWALHEGEEAMQEITSAWRKARQYLDTVARLFSQPPQFTDQVIYLMRSRTALLEELLLPPAQTLSACLNFRERAVAVRQPIEHVVGLWQLSGHLPLLETARQRLRTAAEHVCMGRTFQAQSAYEGAAADYLAAVDEIAPLAQKHCRAFAMTLEPLVGADTGRLPHKLFFAVASGLLQADATQQAYNRVAGDIFAENKGQIEDALHIGPNHRNC